MTEFLCVGLSHKTAPVAVRERLALNPTQQTEFLRRITSPEHEALLVSTCNRVELYVAAPSVERARDAVVPILEELGGPETVAHLYEQRGDAALVHLFRVASSLDSMVLGEPQILGQVKDAYELARKAGAARGAIARACSAAFAAAKQVRSETGIGRAAISMASGAVGRGEEVVGKLQGSRVLVLGAGDMAEVTARHLLTAGAKICVTSRTLARAEELAARVSGVARPFDELMTLLAQSDVVICSTASTTPILTRERMTAVMKARRHAPIFLVDLAVPRDVAPDVNSLDGVFSYDVDDIQKVVSENSAARAAEAAKAEVIIAEAIVRFTRMRAERDALPVLAQLRQHADRIARAEVEKTLANLGPGLSEKQRKSVEAMATAIVNKLLHPPTARLRAGDEDERNRLADATAELFGLGAASARNDEGPSSGGVHPPLITGEHPPEESNS